MTSATPSFYRPDDYIVPTYSEEGVKLSEGNAVDPVGDKLMAEFASARGGKPLKIVGVNKPTTKAVKQKATTKPQSKKPKSKPAVKDDDVEDVLSEIIYDPDRYAKEDVVEEEVEKPVAVKSKPKKRVTFKNAFGEINVTVDDVLFADTGVALVFTSFDDVVFVPGVGNSIEFTFQDATHIVVYTGMLFTWLDGVKKIMCLLYDESNDKPEYDN